MRRIPTMARISPITATPPTGRGLLGVGRCCRSSRTSSEAVMAGLLDLPDGNRKRVAAEGGTEVVLGQLLGRAVIDQRLDPLVESVLVRRALGVDRAVLLTGLVLADHLQLAPGRLCLGEDDRGVEEVGVDLARQQP